MTKVSIFATAKRLTRLIFGLFLYALGSYMCVQGNVGLAPWDAFHLGLSYQVGLSMGTVSVIASLLIVVLDFFLGEKIGVGSLLNACLIGIFLDLLRNAAVIPQMQGMMSGVLLLLAGIATIAFATYFYSSTAWGCGPRDALMVCLCRRFPKVPVGAIRACIEGTVLCVGWLCGAKVGIGTVIAVFGFGAILQAVFRMVRYDVTAVVHESVADTWRMWRNSGAT